MDPAAVERIWAAAEHWYAAGMHPAIQVCLRRDGRVVLLRLTDTGRELVDRVFPLRIEADRELLEGLSAEHMATLADLLRRVALNAD